MNQFDFTKNVEKLVNPINVGTIHFLQQFLHKLPKEKQNSIIESASKESPSMGFVVEPYSSFLCYEIKDIDKASKMLPDHFELTQSKITVDDTPKYYALFGAFNVHTSAFWGQRMEVYLVARDTRTNLLTWIILDYDSNTISYDKKGGLVGPSTLDSVITIDYDGTVIVDVKRTNGNNHIEYYANIKQTKEVLLDEELWIYGNLSIGYGRDISNNNSDVFSLKFNPKEVETALIIPNDKYKVNKNTWLEGLFEEKPSHVLVFPYSQHFISDSPGYGSQLKTKEEMLLAKDNIDFSNVKVYNPDSTTKLITGIPMILLTIIVFLVVLLILK